MRLASPMVVVLVTAIAIDTFADQALVRSYDNQNSEIGQAYLLHQGQRCMSVLPTHVVKEAGKRAALLHEGNKQLLGETIDVFDLEDDLSLADVRGAIASDCGTSIGAISRSVAARIRQNALATLRSVNADGTIAQTAVSIVDDDAENFLRVQPTNTNDQLRKGQSGSLLYAGGQPVGMLLQVDARFGIGKVIRIDTVLLKVERYLRREVRVYSTTQSASALTPVKWSALPIDSSHGVENLTERDSGNVWQSRPAAWPVELIFELTSGRTAISGVYLSAEGVAEALRPRTVDVQLSSVASGERWRSIYNGPLDLAGDEATLTFAPSWARKIRVVIYDTIGSAGEVGLAAISVLRTP